MFFMQIKNLYFILIFFFNYIDFEADDNRTIGIIPLIREDIEDLR